MLAVCAYIDGDLPYSHDVSGAKPGADYCCEDINQLRKAPTPRLDNEAWRNVT